jgi:uncharacterized protein
MKKNPFKFGSVVGKPYFTNRVEEIENISSILKSENHLTIISPRRYGKTSLVVLVLEKLTRPYIFIDLQLITTPSDLASQILKKLNRVYPFEKIKQLIRNFRIIPAISINPLSNEIEVAFKTSASPSAPLEDVLNLIEKLSTAANKLIVVFDEFQEIKRIGKDLDKHLRSVMQHHKKVNYVFIGSQETLMREIFEKRKSPFYHFGIILPLYKIPEIDFLNYLKERLKSVTDKPLKLAKDIIEFTNSHPYYTQKLAFTIWEELVKNKKVADHVKQAVDQIVGFHDVNYERLWNTLTTTERKILIGMTLSDLPPLSDDFSQKYETGATSTTYSSLRKLTKNGYVVKNNEGYEIDDPFFKEWLNKRRLS